MQYCWFGLRTTYESLVVIHRILSMFFYICSHLPEAVEVLPTARSKFLEVNALEVGRYVVNINGGLVLPSCM